MSEIDRTHMSTPARNSYISSGIFFPSHLPMSEIGARSLHRPILHKTHRLFFSSVRQPEFLRSGLRRGRRRPPHLLLPARFAWGLPWSRSSTNWDRVPPVVVMVGGRRHRRNPVRHDARRWRLGDGSRLARRWCASTPPRRKSITARTSSAVSSTPLATPPIVRFVLPSGSPSPPVPTKPHWDALVCVLSSCYMKIAFQIFYQKMSGTSGIYII
jgi:hypothetical protein